VRKSWKLLCIPCHGHVDGGVGEDTGVGRAASASAILFAGAGGDLDML
jgi:hypothetical protein